MSDPNAPKKAAVKPVVPRKPTPRWSPQLGAQVPDFRVETTRGTLNFRPWASGSWAYVFAFPSTFASVCSTELIAFAGQSAAYPARMGRSTSEILRCLEGLKDADYSGLAIPADWHPGEDLVAPKGVDAAEMQRVFGDDWSKVSDYLLVAHIKE